MSRTNSFGLLLQKPDRKDTLFALTMVSRGN